MIETTKDHVIITHPDNSWKIVHDLHNFGGPLSLEVNQTPLLECQSFYIDDLSENSAVLRKLQEYRKAGQAVISTDAYLPFGVELQLRQTCRYAGRHARITFDINWQKNSYIQRHFGVGSLFLPGKWQRYYCLPPAEHLAQGVEPTWHSINNDPKSSPMQGHWHRPPLALVFEHQSGIRLEIGTGNDIWRWQNCMSAAPESASYKIIRQKNGLQLIREPLMCCEEFSPKVQNYRFTWYIAWSTPNDNKKDTTNNPTQIPFNKDNSIDLKTLKKQLAENSTPNLLLDLTKLNFPPHTCRTTTSSNYIRKQTSNQPCWQNPIIQKTARKIIRSIAGNFQEGELTIKGITPGICWSSEHLDRKNPDGISHWDINNILNFSSWLRQHLNKYWKIKIQNNSNWQLPSLENLGADNGFTILD